VRIGFSNEQRGSIQRLFKGIKRFLEGHNPEKAELLGSIISLRRNNYEYIMPLNAILYEMLYFINKLPLEDSLGQQENPSA
jgi:hypothetical protein